MSETKKAATTNSGIATLSVVTPCRIESAGVIGLAVSGRNHFSVLKLQLRHAAKLCFVNGEKLGGMAWQRALSRSWSFGDKRVTKLELGHEE